MQRMGTAAATHARRQLRGRPGPASAVATAAVAAAAAAAAARATVVVEAVVSASPADELTAPLGHHRRRCPRSQSCPRRRRQRPRRHPRRPPMGCLWRGRRHRVRPPSVPGSTRLGPMTRKAPANASPRAHHRGSRSARGASHRRLCLATRQCQSPCSHRCCRRHCRRTLVWSPRAPMAWRARCRRGRMLRGHYRRRCSPRTRGMALSAPKPSEAHQSRPSSPVYSTEP